MIILKKIIEICVTGEIILTLKPPLQKCSKLTETTVDIPIKLGMNEETPHLVFFFVLRYK